MGVASGNSKSASNQSQTSVSTAGANSPAYSAGDKSLVSGGAPIYNLAKGASVTYQTSDSGAINAASEAISQALASVAGGNNATLAAIQSLANSSNQVAATTANSNPTVAAATATMDWTSVLKYGLAALAIIFAAKLFLHK